MVAKDLLVNGDARINGHLYCNFDGYLAEGYGCPVTITDAINHKLMSLTLFGKSSINNETLTTTANNFGISLHNEDENKALSHARVIKLYGIPVSSGGNYTDINGQSWICDSLELRADDTTVIVRRCGHVKLNGSETWATSPTGTDSKYCYVTAIEPLAAVPDGTNKPNMLATRLNIIGRGETWNCMEGITIWAENSNDYLLAGHLVVYDESVSSGTTDAISNWKLSLSSESIDVVYELAESYEENIGDLNNFLRKLVVSDGTSSINNTLGADMHVRYMVSSTLEDTITGSSLGITVRDHISNTNNPHNVSKEQVGLGKVENKNVMEILAELTSAIIIDKLGYTPVDDSHASNKSNPHSVTKTQVGLGNVDNKSATEILAGITADLIIDKLGFEPANKDHVSDTDNPHEVTKEQVGLGSVENKSPTEILALLTTQNITTALGFTPANKDHTHDYVPLSGGTMTGALIGQSNTNYSTPQLRNVSISTADASGGSNGQIHFKYS